MNSVIQTSATGYQLGDQEVGDGSAKRVKNFFFKSSTLILGHIQSPIQWVLGGSFPRVKWLGHVADHSSPTTVNKTWAYTPTPPYTFMT
jgi:hypothetical protein